MRYMFDAMVTDGLLEMVRIRQLAPKPDVVRWIDEDDVFCFDLRSHCDGRQIELIDVVWPGRCPKCGSTDSRWLNSDLGGKFACWDCGAVW